MIKPSALLAVFGTLLLFASPSVSAPVLLDPPGNGIPTLSKNTPVNGLNTEMISTLADDHLFIKSQQGLRIKKNPNEKIYNSSYSLPDKPFSLLCTLSVEQGAIHITVGNIKFIVLPDHTDIYQESKLIKTHESKTIAVIKMGLNGASVARMLNVSRAGVSLAARRGEEIYKMTPALQDIVASLQT